MKHTYQAKKSRYLLFLMTISILLMVSCEKDEPAAPVDMCDNTNYTYTMDLKIIFDTNCATASCHDGNSSLADYSTYDGVFADRIKLQNGINQGLEQVTSGRAQLTQAEQDMILCWIKDGAPE